MFIKCSIIIKRIRGKIAKFILKKFVITTESLLQNNSNLRKPNIGMFNKASKVFNIDKKKSFMIGDQFTDMEFAEKAGIKGYLFKQNNLYEFVKRLKTIKEF